MYAFSSEGEMIIIINKSTHVWGACKYNNELDVARIAIPLIEGDESVEVFSMIFEDTGDDMMDLHLGWDYYRVTLQFSK